MKKILLISLLSLSSYGLWAQAIHNRYEKPIETQRIFEHPKSGYIDTLFAQISTLGMTLLLEPGGGYAVGTNVNAHKAHLQRFTVNPAFSINKIIYFFAKKYGIGDITATIWADSNGVPAAPLRRINLPISSIDTTLFTPTTIDLIPPLSFPELTTFWAGLEYFNMNPGDTVALYAGDHFAYANEKTFTQLSNSSFKSIIDIYGINANWSYWILPVVEYAPIIGNLLGTVFMDVNNNGIKDTNEFGVPYQLVKAGSSYATTDMYGCYDIHVYSAGQYSIKHIIQGYLISDTDSIIVNVNSPGIVLSGNNFPCHSLTGVRDLAVTLTSTYISPGFTSNYWLSYSNQGTQIENGTLRVAIDNQLDYIMASQTPDTISANNFSWNFSNLIPGETRTISLIMNTPSSLPLGSYIISSGLIKPVIGDTLVANNTDSDNTIVIGSFDPNDKSVNPVGQTTEGIIGLNPGQLRYTIRFQNTGTDSALNIVLRDTLDNDMDLSTLRIIASSHPCDYLLSSDRLITVTFNNILLPDSGTNQAASQGFFKYSIKPKSNLPIGTQLTNRADIYFDFNLPVSTNTVLNTIGIYYGVDKNLNYIEKLIIHPNPATTTLTIEGLTQKTTAEVYDISGKLLLSKPLSTKTIDISRLGKGLYFIKLTTAEGSVVRKFVKE